MNLFTTEQTQVDPGSRPRRALIRVERVGLVAAMAVTTMNIWTGAPLVGLWLGAQFAGEGQISMLAVLVAVASMLAIGIACTQLLAVLGATYDRVTGRKRGIRRHTPWLRSYSGDRPHETGGADVPLTMLEYVCVGAVIVCYIVFEIWFFFYSTSPIDGRTGRG